MAEQEKPTSPQSDENQGIPYKLRRIQILDGVILTAIIGMFTVNLDTRDKVSELLTERRIEKEAEAREEARDPVIRSVRYTLELDAIRQHVRAVDGRVVELEEKQQED